MRRVIGMDIHRTFAEVVFWEDGRLRWHGRIDMTRSALEGFGRSLTKDDEVVLEATGNAMAVVRVLSPYVTRVIMANSLQVKAIAHTHVKTDKIDAGVLASLHAAGFLPEVWLPDGETERRRRLVARRNQVVRHRTRVKNETHGILAVKTALVMARLSTIKTLAGFDFTFQPSLDRNRVLALAQLDFVDRHEVVLVWHLLAKDADYLWARPALVAHKLRALELQAGRPHEEGQPTRPRVCLQRQDARTRKRSRSPNRPSTPMSTSWRSGHQPTTRGADPTGNRLILTGPAARLAKLVEGRSPRRTRKSVPGHHRFPWR